MKYRLTSDEEEEEVKAEGEEDEDSASVLQVAIPGDGDCFYLAIVEAFLRDGVDIVALFTGRMGCEVQYLFKHLSCHQKRQEAILSESAPPPCTGNGQWSEVSEACSGLCNHSPNPCISPRELSGADCAQTANGLHNGMSTGWLGGLCLHGGCC